MIHTLTTLTRPLIVYDLETTGLDPAVARVVQIGLQVYTADGMVEEAKTLVNPGVPIPAKALEAHGITDAEVTVLCVKCKRIALEHPVLSENDVVCDRFHPVPTFAQLAARLAIRLGDCDFAGKNVRYDLRVTDAEMRRSNTPWSYHGACIIDADRLEQIGEPRTLTHLYKKHTGQDLEDAHDALADVRATAVVIAEQLLRYEVLPRDLRTLHDLQWPGWVDGEGKFRFDEDGVVRCTFGKHRGVAMKSIPPSYYRWLLDADFPADVKHLAREAIAGRFPTRQ